MISRLLIICLALGWASPAWSQTCQQGCRDECGPITGPGANKAAVAACVRSCIKKCPSGPSQTPPPPVCPSLTGALFPKYYILGLVYAPPGCTSSSSLKCSTQSSVDYQAGSSMGTKVSTENSFSAGVDAKVDASFSVAGMAKFGASVSGGYSNASTDSNSQTVSKGQSLDIKAAGNGDGIDHTQDAFILLLNPAVAVQQTQQVVNNQCGPLVANWYMGVSGSSGTQQRYTVYAEWLKNPSSMPQNVAHQLQTLGFTSTDYQSILAQDPFANGSTTIDNTRFIPTTYSFPYEPPLQASDCNNGVCSCMSMSDTIKNEIQTEVGSKSQTQYSLGFSESAGTDFKVFNAGVSSNQKFTWTSTSTNADTSDSTQSATATVVCPSTSYQGPTIMSIYWDTLFGSFLFVPTTLTPQPMMRTRAPQTMLWAQALQPMILSQGTVIDPTGTPLRHEAVQLVVGGKTYHTLTNNRGDYYFLRAASLRNVSYPPTGQLSTRGVRQVVALGSTQKLQIHVPAQHVVRLPNPIR
jgi:hypothetical protein